MIVSDDPTHFPALTSRGRTDYRRRRLCGATRDALTAAPVQLLYSGDHDPQWCETCSRRLMKIIQKRMGW